MIRHPFPLLLTTFFLIGLTRALPAQKAEEVFRQQRLQMVEDVVIRAGVKDPRVIESMRNTPRHQFMPRELRKTQAYLDAGVPIGESQTISSPFIVAYMTESLDPQPTDKVLEIGTGSGYQAAVLSPLVKEVYSIEIVEPLGRRASKTLAELGYDNVKVKIGDGFKGWPEHAPFDKIIVTCSPEDVPQPLFDQLRDGGLMVVPMGERHQQTLYLLRKQGDELVRQSLRPTLFVPMTGEAEAKRQVLPDPANPRLINGDFEEPLDDEGFVPGWYYQRLLEWVEEPLAPGGMHFIRFKNEVPGQMAHLMQGFSIDGREVSAVDFAVSIASDDVQPGPDPADVPVAMVTFYDEFREVVGKSYFGPITGSQTWRNYQRRVLVPAATREAIVRLGMFGATGSTSFDRVVIRKVESGK